MKARIVSKGEILAHPTHSLAPEDYLGPMGPMVELPEGPVKHIHVDQHRIRANNKRGSAPALPPISVKTRGRNYKGMEIEVEGPVIFRYSPDEPLLSCGARLVASTTARVVVRGMEESEGTP